MVSDHRHNTGFNSIYNKGTTIKEITLVMEQQEKRGYVQVYTGNGKGKTTASFGLALRAAGAGKKVFIGQFAKGQLYSEINAVRAQVSLRICNRKTVWS